MKFRIAENFRALFYAPFYATQALGLYSREGIDVELIPSSVPGSAISALIDGTLDLTWGGPMRIMKAHDDESNSPLVSFCEVVSRDPFYLIGRVDHANFTLADLSHMRFATVSEVPTPWMCLQHDLRELGIDPNQLARVTDGSMADHFSDLRNGVIDVAQVFEPFVSMALQQRVGNILYTASQRGPTIYTAFIGTRRGIARNRAAFGALVRAVQQMQAWLVTHDAEELAKITAPYYSDIPYDILASSLHRYRDAGIWAKNPEVSQRGFARLGESLVSGGFISRMPIFADCVDQSLR